MLVLTRQSIDNELSSSDLWVTGDVPGTKDLGKSVSVSYAVGTAAGACVREQFEHGQR